MSNIKSLPNPKDFATSTAIMSKLKDMIDQVEGAEAQTMINNIIFTIRLHKGEYIYERIVVGGVYTLPSEKFLEAITAARKVVTPQRATGTALTIKNGSPVFSAVTTKENK